MTPVDGMYLRDRRSYEALDFGGWRPFAELGRTSLPASPGVYVVLRPSATRIAFRSTSSAGTHKGRTPTVTVARLEEKWVTDTATIYIGKATQLNERLDAYRRHGGGASAGHWGGRFVWQCQDSAEFLVGWRTTDTATKAGDLEYDLLAAFRATHDGRLPFANLNKGRSPV